METIKEIQCKQLVTNRLTGEILESIPPNSKRGEYRIQQCFADVPSQADQSQRDENNISLLVKKYKPDELAQYLALKNQSRTPIEDHDFSEEPNLQEAMNSAYQIKEQFASLPEEIQFKFRGNPVEFLKFCANPQNLKQLEQWGLATISILKKEEPINASNANEAPSKEEQKKS